MFIILKILLRHFFELCTSGLDSRVKKRFLNLDYILVLLGLIKELFLPPLKLSFTN